LSKSDTLIREAFLAPKPSLVLPSTWVKLTGVPEDLMTKDRLKAVFTMIGRPIDVDELSIQKRDREPIRMRFHCRFPQRIKGSVQVFVNGEGFTVGVQAETPPRGGAGGSGGPPPPPPDRRDQEDDYDSDYLSSEGEWNKHGRRRRGNDQGKDKEKEKEAAPPAGGKGGSAAGATAKGSQSAPPAMKGMDLGLKAVEAPIDQYGSNLGLDDLQLPSRIVDGEMVAVTGAAGKGSETGLAMAGRGGSWSTETGSQLMGLDSEGAVDSPVAEGPPAKIARRGPLVEELAEVESVDALEDQLAMRQEAERQPKDLQADVLASSTLVQGKRTKAVPYTRRAPTTPASAIRKSSSNAGAAAGSTALMKAQKRMADKNLETTANKDTGTDFNPLDLLSDNHISKVVKDSCVVFCPSGGTPGEAISLLRAKERVQAALAATARRLELEELAKKAAESGLPDEVAGAVGNCSPEDPRQEVEVRDPPELVATGGEPAARLGAAVEGSDLLEPGLHGSGSAPARKVTRRRRKSTLTVRKGRGKRIGSS
jgi:hypothetical protein